MPEGPACAWESARGSVTRPPPRRRSQARACEGPFKAPLRLHLPLRRRGPGVLAAAAAAAAAAQCHWHWQRSAALALALRQPEGARATSNFRVQGLGRCLKLRESRMPTWAGAWAAPDRPEHAAGAVFIVLQLVYLRLIVPQY